MESIACALRRHKSTDSGISHPLIPILRVETGFAVILMHVFASVFKNT